NGTGVDAVSGATFSSKALKDAVNDAAEQAGVTNKDAFTSNTVETKAQDPIEDTWDVVVVGGGGAGMAAAAQAAQNGDSVLVIEKNAEVGGNTLVSGGQYQSVMPYLVWDPSDPDATTGKGYDGNEYNKVKSVQGCIDELKTILNWSEEPFDEDYYKDHEYVAGDIEELSKHGVVADYLPTLQALKKEIQAYLDWAQPKLDAGTPESDLTLFSTVNLHIFQTYYGGLRQSADKSSWIYGDVDLVSQFIEDGQDLKPWLEDMGSTFVEDTQPTLIGALWYRENQFIGADVDTDGDGQKEEYKGRWGTYFVAPMTSFLNANDHNQIMTRTTAEELIQEDGRVSGVKATMYDGTEVTAHAKKGVVLATGGYAANIKKVVETNEYWDPEYLNEKTETTNRGSLQGDGITMAEAVGAATTGMGYTQLMPISWVDNGDLAFGGGDYAVYINPTTGKRFVDETSERDVLSLGEFRNGIEWNGHKGVFIEIANAATPIPGPYPYQDEDEDGRQYVRTIGELADLLKEEGFDTDVETIKATIEDYDQAIINGTQPADVSKKQFSALIGDCEKNDDGSYKADTYNLDDAKLRIRFLAPSTHHTMGGVAVDTKRHVLDADGKVIDGLYAAGEVTGGIHGGNRLGGNAITEIFVSGRTAANAITEDN
ncbi:MAG TPA: FMN-binding protein, partial [Oribacterium sp.]|nr:FMN-binding protein [Oribacterium sp.]